MTGRLIDYAEAERKILSFLSDYSDVPVEKITPGASLKQELEIDSFSAIELMFSLKDECGLDITAEEISKFETVKDILDWVRKVL